MSYKILQVPSQFPLDAVERDCYGFYMFRRSSVVEQLTVNQFVASSSLARGATSLFLLNQTFSF